MQCHCLCPSDAPDAMGMWRHDYARADREETHPLHGDPLQTTSTPAEISGEASSRQERGQTPGAESVQARKPVCPPRLGEKQRGQKDPSSPIPYTDNRILGHGHLTVTTNTLKHLSATQPTITHALSPLGCAVSSLQHQGYQDSQ